eukprot:364443-Chlamydomonas_euryale.AAC.26
MESPCPSPLSQHAAYFVDPVSVPATRGAVPAARSPLAPVILIIVLPSAHAGWRCLAGAAFGHLGKRWSARRFVCGLRVGVKLGPPPFVVAVVKAAEAAAAAAMAAAIAAAGPASRQMAVSRRLAARRRLIPRVAGPAVVRGGRVAVVWVVWQLPIPACARVSVRAARCHLCHRSGAKIDVVAIGPGSRLDKRSTRSIEAHEA